jgi:tRNA wybutosine-synthesizing protein 2
MIMVLTPFDKIKQKLRNQIPESFIKKLPSKWEKNGDIVVLILSKYLTDYEDIIGKVYAEVLKCRSVLKDIGGITGDFRTPNVELIYGSNDTITIHKENGVRYKLDPQKIMFSSGNMDERIRMSNISNKDEIVVDLFAGIGYFSLPIAVHSKPKKIFACEKNPVAFSFLSENIVLNHVTSIVESIKGDNRDIAPKNIANRVIMGYIGGTEDFITTAFNCLKNFEGFIHFHEKYPDKNVPKKPINILQKKAKKKNLKVEVLGIKNVKSFAPGISHYVFDIKIGGK